MPDYNYGIYGDGKGYSICVVQLEKEIVNYESVYIYTVLAESFNLQSVSKREIEQMYNKLCRQYRPDAIYTNLPVLKKWLDYERYINVLELNLTEGLFVINSLMADQAVRFTNDSLRISLVSEIHAFGENIETVNHRAFALMLTLSSGERPHSFAWLSA